MSTLKNRLCSFLSRLVLLGLVALLVVLSPALARASVTTFDVSGTAANASGAILGSCAVNATACPFSGMFQVNTTTGTLVSGSFDVTLPGLDTFDNVASSSSGSGLWFIFAFSASGDELQFAFTTAPTPGSLVGFTGGSIVGVGDTQFNYAINGGSITPVPEPSSVVLFGTGMLVLGLARRFGKKAVHPLSA